MRPSPDIAARWLLLAVLVGLGAGCDRAEDLTDVEAIEARLRHDPTRQGRVGMLRGLEVGQQAARVARALAERVEPACATGPASGPTRLDAELTLERRLGGRTTMRWEERRTLRRDEAGRLRLDLEATYTPLGAPEGRLARWWYADDEGVAAGEAGVSTFAAYPADEAMAASIASAGASTLQALLDAAEVGWAPVEPAEEAAGAEAGDASWTLGGARLVCGPTEDAPRGFVTAFAADAEATSGRLDVRGDTRRLELRWALPDGGELVARYRDEVAGLDEPLARPEGTPVDAERERDGAAIDASLEQLVTAGAARRAPGKGESEEDDREEDQKVNEDEREREGEQR